jgi:uncharacterized membrane protein YbaN (DUF454 family)
MRWLPANRYLRLIAGAIFILVGLAGLILPILPGWALIFVGLFILAEDFHSVRRLVEWALCKLERYEYCRPYVDNYRRNRARREAPRDERGSD